MKQYPSRQRVITLIVCTILPLLLTTALPVVSYNMPEAAPAHRATFVNVQETPTVDQTVTALQKEKLEHDNNWFWNNGSTLLSVLAIILTALFGLWRWRREQHTEREKRDEDRFQKAIEGLGSDRIEARVGAAIMLRTFLGTGYQQFYSQTFDLAVAQLRPSKEIPDTPEPLDTLRQALITVFKESFHCARDVIKQKTSF